MFLDKPFKEKTKITSPFGLRVHPILKVSKLHKGVDLSLPEGTELIAPVDCYVEYKEQKSPEGELVGYGKYVKLFFKTEQGNNAMVLFGHLSEVFVKNTHAKKNDIVALSGNTGSSTGPHLHLGVFIHDSEDGYAPVDPEKYINLA